MNTTNKPVAVVTGGSQGLGRAITETLAQNGYFVVIGDIQVDKAQAVTEELTQQGHSVLSWELNVAEADSVRQFTQQVVQQLGAPQAVINNAGVDVTKPLEEMSIEEWNRVINVNLNGPLYMAKHFLPEMYTAGRGHLINVASTAAKRAWPNASAYHASKWGLVGLSHALYTEARQHGVKVSAVIAGGMRTPFILDRFPDVDPNLLQDPQHVANTILFLLQQPTESIIPEVMVLPLLETSWP